MKHEFKSGDSAAPASADEIRRIASELQSAFSEFKANNDRALTDLLKKGEVDGLVEEKTGRINTAISELQARLNTLEVKRPDLGAQASERETDYKKAFIDYARKGDQFIPDLERKAVSVGTSADGGYALPKEINSEIERLVKQVSPMRSLARVVNVTTSDWHQLVSGTQHASGWVAEAGSRASTATATFNDVAAIMGEVYCNAYATQRSLDDLGFDVSRFIIEETANEFATQEGAAFITGTGTNKPKGITAYTANTSSDGARTFGDLEMVKTGVAGAFITTTTTASPADTLIDVIHKVKAAYRANGVFMMNATTLGSVRKFKDAQGHYIWQPALAAGQPSTLLGYPVYEAADMPDVATDTLPIAFGDFRRGYTIVDRNAGVFLRDPYSAKPYVLFYTTKRVGGMVVNSEAIKFVATRT